MFQLRVALLRNQNRRDDLESFLLNAASRTNSLEVLALIENTARVDGFPKAQQASIEKQIALMSDPVEKMRLRLALARFEEGQGRAAQGAAVVDALYRENPAILGVVRAAVDYHWRNKDSRRAVDILEEASSRSSAAYRSPFLVEAARKATDSGDYTRARIMVGYLQVFDQPYKAEYIALKADTYARQGDDRGLRAFYETTIRSLSGATTIPAQQRTDQIASIRASLIPVLTRVKDYSAAVDQYIEILNRFPDDDGLAREAALYAQQNGVAKKLHDFYAKTAADSPKDYRWPMVLARIETQTEDYPAAIASYTRAAVVRPDRIDLIKERLNLEERLLRFDEAATSAQKLYDLTYRNPMWMEKLAELRARQGRTADAVTALNKAWIDGRSESAANYLTVAQKLESWGMLPEARKYAEEALKRAPEDSVKIWARILARQQQYDAVFAKLPALKAATAAQVAQTVAAVAATYSAGDKAKFAASIEKQLLRISLAENAGLTDLELKWRLAAAMARPGTAASNQSIERIAAVEKSQLRFDELGAQLEAYDRILPPQSARHEAEEEDCYRASGNTVTELRVLKRLADRHEATGPLLERYTQLLISQPQRLAAAIAAESDAGTVNSMLNYVMQHASSAVAQQAIAARGQKNGALWTKAYTSLTGLYFASSAAPVRTAFTAILGPITVGARIGKPTDRDQQLAGDDWFYYGGRYGEYLGAIKQAGSEDYLPAMVEATPGRSEAYFTMAEYSGSIADYQYALELNPTRADVHDRLAVIAAKAGRSADAVREWKLALATFSQMMDRSRVPQKFWPDLSDTLRHIGEAHQLPAVRDDVDKILRTYIRRNGSFQIEGILESAFIASGDPAAGLNWIAELSRHAADPVQFLNVLIDQRWVPDAHKNILYRQIVESAEARVSQTFGEQQSTAQNLLWTSEMRWVAFLLTRRDDPTALQTAATMLAEGRKQKIREAEVVELEVRLAARTRTLAAQLAKYRDPFPLDALRSAANTLAEEGDAVSARRVLEFIYASQMKAGNLDQATFLGLAEVRIQDNDLAGAMALLRRMVLISGEPFTGLDPAGALLERTRHPAEAAEFLTTLIKAEPWNQDAKRRLAEAQGTAPKTTNPWDALPAAAPAKEKALLAIIAADPRPTAPRVLLFHAAVENRHHALALAVARQLLPQFFREDSEYTEWVARSFLPAFDSAERSSIARGMADAEQRLGDPHAAFLYASIAQFIAPSDAARRTVNLLRAQLEAEAKNETRRPMVNDGVDQDRLVRPKVGAL